MSFAKPGVPSTLDPQDSTVTSSSARSGWWGFDVSDGKCGHRRQEQAVGVSVGPGARDLHM